MVNKKVKIGFEMTNEKLKQNIAELFEVSDSEKEITFLLFKKKLAEYLKVGEAIKINSLGVFQLKEQLTEGKRSKNKKVIIFSANNEVIKKESLFLTLEIEQGKKNNSEFDEKVFNLGIGKPTIPLGSNKDNGIESITSIEERVKDIISNSEKLESFDLWDDYLDGKQTAASLLDTDEEDIGDLDKYLQDENTSPKPSDFVELDEDELLSEFENSDIFGNEELEVDEIIDNSKVQGEIEAEEIYDEKINEVLEDVHIDTEEIISDVESIKPDTNEIVESKIESEFYDTDEEDISNKIETVKKEGESFDNKVGEVVPQINNEEFNEKLEENNMAHPGMKNFKKGPSPTIIALIVAFFIVGAIGIYYLFFDNPTWLYDQNEIEIALSEKHAKEFEEAKRKALEIEKNNIDKKIEDKTNDNKNYDEKDKVDISKKVDDNSVKITNKKNIKESVDEIKKTNTKKSIAAPKVNKTKVTKKILEPKKSIKKSKTSTKINKNIYFDGTNYSVQISSWPRESLAQKEVKRLSNKGYSVYIMEAYIPKFKKNWYRVRIGDIPTLEKAESIQQKVK